MGTRLQYIVACAGFEQAQRDAVAAVRQQPWQPLSELVGHHRHLRTCARVVRACFCACVRACVCVVWLGGQGEGGCGQRGWGGGGGGGGAGGGFNETKNII